MTLTELERALGDLFELTETLTVSLYQDSGRYPFRLAADRIKAIRARFEALRTEQAQATE
jgi:hypothetical protein